MICESGFLSPYCPHTIYLLSQKWIIQQQQEKESWKGTLPKFDKIGAEDWTVDHRLPSTHLHLQMDQHAAVD